MLSPAGHRRGGAFAGLSVLPIHRSVAALRAQVAEWRKEGLRVAFVPTMGALHEGHLSLVTAGLKEADRVAVSIFVNPTQFGPNEDFAAYPRTEAADAGLLEKAGAHAIFAPSVDEMYPAGASTTVTVAGVSEGLCGAFRPGHFAGVATVVTKL
ncbi:MAG TPA: pantoate--beta-alanine ligase, partial [Magnetospirillaceae bacterium]|nr:pantoate--beta-alanine ligase [Magnetospirillaceae bacterium]